jgi:hypothetical protein
MAVQIFELLRQRVLASNGLLPMEKRAMFFFQNFSYALKEWQRTYRGTTFDELNKSDIAKRMVTPQQAKPGFLYFFLYDPKLSQTLPYYDQFPFVLVLDKSTDSFLGLNFHYLDYYHRAMLFDVLYPLRDTRHGKLGAEDLRTRIRVTYDILQLSKKYKFFRPCLKRYLLPHIQSPLLQVGQSDWPIALFLPVESFAKSPIQTVWADSNQKV